MTFTVRRGVLVATLRDAWPVGVAIGGMLIATWVGFAMSDREATRGRCAGMVLQLLGVGTVAVGVRQVRRQFGRPSVVENTRAWFRRLAAAFTLPKPITVGAAATGAGTGTGRASGVIIARPGASLESRVEILDRNFDCRAGHA